MQVPFVKSHGLGNDYLVLVEDQIPFALTPDAIRRLCDRHIGIGSDGVLLKVDAGDADFGIRIFNPDGSEAEKSGNGLRIFCKFLYEHGHTSRTQFTVNTLGGVVAARLEVEEGRVKSVRVEMGQAVIDRRITALMIDGRKLDVTALSMGNPHCVVIVDDLEQVDLHRLGPLIEKNSAFPRRTNVQFAQVLSRREVTALVWERGAGATAASGSSACAVAVACFDKGLVDGQVVARMPGGELVIEVDGNLDVTMSGPAQEICSGVLSQEMVEALVAGGP